MKFKNYRNSFNNSNRIYSEDDILNMTLQTLFDSENDLLAQNREIGIPTSDELHKSSNVIWIENYTKNDGTEVKGHWRSLPDGKYTGAASNIETNNTQNSFEEKFIKPLNGRITSDFGYREAPTKGASTGHSGIDIAVPPNTPVQSIADGVVVAAREGMIGYGTGVFIDHGIVNGKHLISEYGHLSKFNVKVGDKVKKGDVIAKSGNTGTSTGPHLHITIREDKKPVDPKKYLGNFH